MIISAFLLLACGGGGGGSSSGGGGGGGGASSSTLTLSSSNVTISTPQWGSPPEFTDVTATLTGAAEGLTVAFAPGASTADWLVIETADGSQSNQVLLRFTTNTTSLAPGNYNTSLRVTSGNAAGAALDTRDIAVRLSITAGVAIELSPTEIDLGLVRVSDTPVTRTVSVTAEGDWTASSLNNSFSLSANSGNGPGDIELTFVPNSISADSDTLTVTDADASDNQSQTQITYSFVAEIESSPAELAFESVADGEARTETISITASGETLDWGLSADEPWISFSSTSGQTDADVIVTANPAGLAAGTYMATITLTEPVGSQSKAIPVTFEVAPKRLIPSTKGLLLNSFPSSSKLTANIAIDDNARGGANWTAVSDAAWLSVTASGITGDTLIATADPSAVTVNSFSEATVTLSSGDVSISEDTTLKIGFWRGSADPTAVLEEISQRYFLAADPVRPYVYLGFNEDSFGTDRIETYNIYTGAKVGTAIEPTINPGNMSVSDDGAFLYVTDDTSGGDSTIIERIDLETGQPLNQWSLVEVSSGGINAQNEIHFARVEGVPAIYSAVGAVLHGETGEVLGQYPGSGLFTVSKNGRTVCFDTTSVSPNSAQCTTLNVSGLASGEISITPNVTTETPFSSLNFGTDIALSPDGETVYIADQFDFKRANVDDFIYIPGGFNVDPFVGDVEVAQNGEVFIFYESLDAGVNAIRRFTPDGATIATGFTTESILDNDTLVISGDGSRTAITTFDSDNTDDNFWRLEIVTVE